MTDFLRSFSFRAGLILFLGLGITLILLRITAFQQSISSSYEDIRSILNAHIVEIDEEMERDGPGEVMSLVEALMRENHDRNLYMSFSYQAQKTGNLNLHRTPGNGKWGEIKIHHSKGSEPLHLYVKQVTYPHHAQLIVGYDLHRIDQLRHTLLRVLAENLALSLILSLLLSASIIWLLNRHLHHINLSFRKIMAGNLHYRLPIRKPVDQFDQLGLNLNRMLDWIEILISTVKESSNAIAHDMRTPLSRHRLELRALISHPKLPAELRESLNGAIERVDTLTEMFDNILNIARAESRSGTELFAPVDLTSLTSDIAEFYAPLLEQRNQQLQLELPEYEVWLTGDKQLLGQAILNLVDNAVKYTQENFVTKPRSAFSVWIKAATHLVQGWV